MSKLRVVFDSNVIISGFLFGGHPARLLEYALASSIHSFTSLPILDEVRNVLQRPKFGLSSEQALTFVEELHELFDVVTPTKRVRIIAADPDDNIILECAQAANAAVIISGDSHLLDLGRWNGIDILTPDATIGMIQSQPKR